MRTLHRMARLLVAAAALAGCSASEETVAEQPRPPAPPVEETARRAHDELERMARSISEGGGGAPADLGTAQQQLEAGIEQLRK